MVISNKPIGTIGYLGGLPFVFEKFCWAFSQMVQYNTEYLCKPGQYVHYDRATASFHSFARNQLVDNMFGAWLLQLDADHAPEPDLACRMLNLMNLYEMDVLTALYLHKNPPYSPVLYQFSNDGESFLGIGDWDRSVTAIQIGSSGGGALLVRKHVFERIRNELKVSPFDIEHPYGEDHSFFRRCKKLGIDVWAAPKIESPHLAIKEVTLDDYEVDFSQIASRTDIQGFK